MSKNSKPPKLVAGSGGDISRRDFTNSAVALGATTALVTSVGGATGLLMPGAAKAATPKKGWPSKGRASSVSDFGEIFG